VLGAPGRNPAEVNDLDFMNLLVAQIQNQDPLSPMDNSEFTSQITQFTALEEMQAMNDKLDDNLMVGQSINNTGMLALVGKDVTVDGNMTWVTNSEPSENVIATDLPGRATIEVTDSLGHVVATYERDVQAGLTEVTWDGQLEDGSAAPDGQYTISVTVKNGEADIPFSTLMTGAVDGLRYENNVAVVTVGGQEFYVSDIYKVS